jgi:hypothetical protein
MEQRGVLHTGVVAIKVSFAWVCKVHRSLLLIERMGDGWYEGSFRKRMLMTHRYNLPFTSPVCRDEGTIRSTKCCYVSVICFPNIIAVPSQRQRAKLLWCNISRRFPTWVHICISICPSPAIEIRYFCGMQLHLDNS